MADRDLQSHIDSFRLGAKVHALRKAKSMGLAQLAAHTGMSAGMLSKIERGRSIPTLQTLTRIAMVFSVGLDYFFDGPRQKPLREVTRASDRLELPDKPGTKDPVYRFQSLDFAATERKFSSYLAAFDGKQERSTPTHAHTGVEFVYVISGTLRIDFDEGAFVLAAGDSIYFDARVKHSYAREGKPTCRALVVTAP